MTVFFGSSNGSIHQLNRKLAGGPGATSFSRGGRRRLAQKSGVRERIRQKRRRTSAHDRAARRASLSHRVPKGRSERGGRPRPQCRDLSYNLIPETLRAKIVFQTLISVIPPILGKTA